jgi:hypothetical protein
LAYVTEDNWISQRNGIRDDVDKALPDPTEWVRPVADMSDEVGEANAGDAVYEAFEITIAALDDASTESHTGEDAEYC